MAESHEPLHLNLDGVYRSKLCSAEDLQSLHPQLAEIQADIEQDVQRLASGDIPKEKQPLDAAFYPLPERLLDAYAEHRQDSELGRILATAQRLRDHVDRVVVLGIGGSYMGARALMDGCCHPYYNELSRAERGGWPRLAFAGNNLDNDNTRGLLHLLQQGADDVDGRWAIVVISKGGGTLETAAALRIFLRQLQSQFGAEATPQLVVPVTGAEGKLRDLSAALQCPEVFDVPDGVGGRFSVLSPVGLLPAAIVGIDIVQLLRGAAQMNRHFRTAPPGENMVLDYAAAGHFLETERNIPLRVQCAWSSALESTGLWYDQLFAESLGKHGRGATPLTAVNTRDLHSRAQQHQEGRGDKLYTNWIVDHWREDPLAVGHSDHDQDTLNDLAEKTMPELMDAAVRGTNEALESAGRPIIDLRLPHCNSHALGQLMQMLMLATVVEGRLLKVNPYGQPGVEAYKNNMSRLLGRS